MNPNPNKALWEQGDFTRIAATMRASGEALVERTGVVAGMKVLDLGCGDGTTALPAARRGADVLGVDIAANLVAAGNRRAREAGLAERCRFLEGDACELGGLENGSFDRVVSIFGAMFAPRPFDVAREMVRVTRRGGRIVMGNWIPGDPTLVAQILRICAAYTPAPPVGFVSPMTWGVEAQVRERFGAAGIAPEAVTCERDTWVFEFQGLPAEFVDTFRRWYGPTMNAFAAAERDGRGEALRDELVELFASQNHSQYPGTCVIPATYLRVTVGPLGQPSGGPGTTGLRHDTLSRITRMQVKTAVLGAGTTDANVGVVESAIDFVRPRSASRRSPQADGGLLLWIQLAVLPLLLADRLVCRTRKSGSFFEHFQRPF